MPFAAPAPADAGAPDNVPSPEASPEVDPPAAGESSPPAPELRRRRRPREQLHPHRPALRLRLSPVLLALALLLTLGIGTGLGWLLGRPRPGVAGAANAPGGAAPSPGPAEPAPFGEALPADPAEEIETAYAALGDARPLEARDRFLGLAARADPNTRAASALRAAAAWCELAAARPEAAEGLLVAGLGRANGGESADTRFLLGIARLLRGEHAEAEKSFARAAALDPTRADVHLLWGDILRREGRPRESVSHFRAALLRNRQEINVGFYQLKLWLAQLQAGGDLAAEASAAIAASLRAGDHPAGTVLLAAAARASVAENWAEAADLLRRARRATEPAIFIASLRDSFFAEQSARPEFAEFFAAVPPPAGGTR